VSGHIAFPLKVKSVVASSIVRFWLKLVIVEVFKCDAFRRFVIDDTKISIFFYLSSILTNIFTFF